MVDRITGFSYTEMDHADNDDDRFCTIPNWLHLIALECSLNWHTLCVPHLSSQSPTVQYLVFATRISSTCVRTYL